MQQTDAPLERIAEYADSSVRILHRQGSLLGVPGAFGHKHRLYERWGNRGNAIYTTLGSLLAISVSGGAAIASGEPLVFPSLGATAFLIFETPTAEVGTPRNTIIGHAVAVGVAALALALFGLYGEPSAFEGGLDAARAGAIAMSVAFTGGLLRLLRSAHPPAGATTIIVSIRAPRHREPDARRRRRRPRAHRGRLGPEPRDGRARADVGGAALIARASSDHPLRSH